MPTILSFLSGRQITNDSGVPQAGAKVYHYRATTTTNLTVWQNSGATVAHAQPVVCDAGGFVPLVYVDDTFNWKIVVTTAADVILPQYNFDNLEKAPPASPAATYSLAQFPWSQVSAASSPVALTAADAGKAYEADTTGGNVEFDLPPAGDVPNGTGFIFKKTVAANSMIIDPNGAETIDDSVASLSILNVMEAVGVYSNTAEWYKVLSHFNDSVAIQPFTASGTYTPNVRMRQCLVVSTGAGGGGGGADSSDGSSSCAGGGGGAGGTCIELFTAVQIGASQAITIGAGGVAGANTGTNGGVGGNTTFGALHTANGGAGGVGSVTLVNDATDGGAGGTATGGLINITGGGGGSSHGIDPCATSGGGGASYWGGGGQGRGQLGTGTKVGINGAAFGSGASGGANVNDTNGIAGGVGAAGIVVVIEFLG